MEIQDIKTLMDMRRQYLGGRRKHVCLIYAGAILKEPKSKPHLRLAAGVITGSSCGDYLGSFRVIENCLRKGLGLAPLPAPKSKKRRRKRRREPFYTSSAWRRLRYEALKDSNGSCCLCGRRPPDVVLHVDHIKPRSKYPELALSPNNVQVICEDCNLGKGSLHEDDWRGPSPGQLP